MTDWSAQQLADGIEPVTVKARQLALRRFSAWMAVIQTAEENGFNVGEDFSVQDRSGATGPMAAERQAQAQAHAASIGSAVTALHTHDTAVAGAINAHSAALTTTQFADGKPVYGGVQMVDNGGTDYDPSKGGGNFERKFWNDVITDAIAGAAIGTIVDGIGAIPGALGGAAWAGIKDGLHFIAGDGHDY